MFIRAQFNRQVQSTVLSSVLLPPVVEWRPGLISLLGCGLFIISTVIASISSSSSSASLFQRPFVWSLISSSPTFQFYSNVAPPRDKTLSHCHCCCCNESTVHNNWTVMGLRATFESDKKPSSSSNQTFPLPFALFFLRSCSASWIRDPMIRHDLKLSAERTCTERSA